MEKRFIWTMGHFPFQMGGYVDRPMSTEIEIIEERRIGKGFKAFSFKTPKGTLKIAESITGALVGDSFEAVISDVKGTTKKIIEQQIVDAKNILHERGKHQQSPEEFFKHYKY